MGELKCRLLRTSSYGDNGAPFNSFAFSNYAKYIGFDHRKITPLWPRANAQAESFNKPLMKSIRAAHLEGKNCCQEMHKFLRQYQSTPHPSTKFAPFHLLFGRSPRTKFPEIPNKLDHESAASTQAKVNDKSAKANAKQYADRRNKAKERDFQIGDKVLVKSERGNKFKTPYEPEPHAYHPGKEGIHAYSSFEGESRYKKLVFLQKTPRFHQPQASPASVRLRKTFKKKDSTEVLARLC